MGFPEPQAASDAVANTALANTAAADAALTNTALVAEVCRVLAGAGDAGRAVAQQRYMKSAMPFHGIPAPQLKTILRPVLADPAYRLQSRREWEATVRTLWDGATHREDRYAAIALTGHRGYRKWQDPETIPLYRHLILTGAWWDLVDEVAARRVGPILRDHPEQTTPVLRSWAVGEGRDDMWLRRAAIISQVGSHGATDTALLAACIEANLEGSRFGSQFWIRKSVGWALRQYARTDPEWVRKAVAGYGNRLSGLSRREALKHLGPG